MIGYSGSHSSPTSLTLTSPTSATSRLENRVTFFPFFSVVAFFGGLPFFLPNCASSQSCFKLCFLLVNCHESSSLFDPLAPRLAASVVAHWGGNQTVLWPLVLRLLASAELCSTWPASPPDHRESHLIWVDSIPMIPLAWSRMSLERPVGTRKFPTTLVTLSLQLWS